MSPLKLYILFGLPFSGKSTLARKIAQHTKSQLVSFDLMWKEKEKELNHKMTNEETWKFIKENTHKRTEEYLSKGISVVYDDTNLKYEHREFLRDIAQRYGATPIVIYVNTPFEMIKQREADNKINQQRHKVVSKFFNNAFEQLEPPRPNEKVIEYTPETDTENWLKNLIF